MTRPTIALDMDGCLADFNPLVVDALREAGYELEYDDIKTFRYGDTLGPEANEIAWDVIRRVDLYDSIEPEPGAKDAVAKLREFADVVALSSPVEDHARSKMEWLLRFGFGRSEIILASNKDLAGAGCSLLVDDAIHNIESWSRRVVVFDRPWNRHLKGEYPRATRWDEVPDLAREALRPETVTEEGARLVDGPRQTQYGHPADNFKVIAGVWSALLEHDVPVWAVPRLMVGLKLARDFSGNRKRDNLVDVVGYARTAEMVDEYLPSPDAADRPELE